MDYDDEEYRGIRDLEYLLEEVSEDDKDYYKPERVRNAFKYDTGEYDNIVYKSRGSKYYDSVEEYLSKIRPYLEITCLLVIGKYNQQLVSNLFLLQIQSNIVLGTHIVKILKL